MGPGGGGGGGGGPGSPFSVVTCAQIFQHLG